MSEQNVAVIRALYDATANGDVETALSLIDPEIEINYRGAVPDLHDRDLQGHAGVAEVMATVTSEFSDFHAEPEELIDAGDHVVVTVFQRGRGKASGLEVERRVGQVWTVAHGSAIRWRIFNDREEALAAVGLSG